MALIIYRAVVCDLVWQRLLICRILMVTDKIRPLPIEKKGKRYNISLTYLLHYQYRSIAMLAMQNKTYIKDHNGNKKSLWTSEDKKPLEKYDHKPHSPEDKWISCSLYSARHGLLW